jgi:hypothetical protein
VKDGTELAGCRMRTPAASRGGGTPPRPLAAGKPQRWFVLQPWAFDITSWLLRAAPRPHQPLPVGPWACAYGLLPAVGSGPHMVSLIGPGADFGPQYAMGTDLDQPLIIAPDRADAAGPSARRGSAMPAAMADPKPRPPESTMSVANSARPGSRECQAIGPLLGSVPAPTFYHVGELSGSALPPPTRR